MPRRWQVFAISVGGAIVAFLDVTIVSVAFPSIEAGFPGTPRSTLSWVLSAYNIVFAALLVPAGRLADVVGRRRVFTSGLTGFTLASAACAVAPSAEMLIGARICQAVAAAAIIPTSLAFVLAEFPISERAKGAGLWAAAAAVSAAIGPTLGGLLSESGSWRLIFVVNLPICLLCIGYGRRILEEAELKPGPLPDLGGVVLVIAAVGSMALGVVQGNTWGWSSPAIVSCFVLTIVLISLFVRRSSRHRSPVVDLEFFRDRAVSMGNLGTLIFSAAGYGIILNNVLFLTDVWGYSAMSVGLALTPAPIAMAVSAGPGGWIADRYGQRLVAIPGALLFALGAVWFATGLTSDPDLIGRWLPGALMTGSGAGLAYPALGSAAVMTLAPDRFAVGSALNAMFRQIGAAIGVALIVAVVGSTTELAGAADAYERGWVLIAAMALTAAIAAAALGRIQASDEAPHFLVDNGRSEARAS